jgi:hypothetical protein
VPAVPAVPAQSLLKACILLSEGLFPQMFSPGVVVAAFKISDQELFCQSAAGGLDQAGVFGLDPDSLSMEKLIYGVPVKIVGLGDLVY